MAIREFMGLDVPAFKRFYKDSKKNNVQMKRPMFLNGAALASVAVVKNPALQKSLPMKKPIA